MLTPHKPEDTYANYQNKIQEAVSDCLKKVQELSED